MTPTDFALLGIDPETIAKVWAWGFGSVMSMWGFGYTIGVATGLVNKV
jgi:hypothetical protein